MSSKAPMSSNDLGRQLQSYDLIHDFWNELTPMHVVIESTASAASSAAAKRPRYNVSDWYDVSAL